MSLDEFLANSKKRFVAIKQIEIIGEACVCISTPVKDRSDAAEAAAAPGVATVNCLIFNTMNLAADVYDFHYLYTSIVKHAN